jgi:hypothetical protein
MFGLQVDDQLETSDVVAILGITLNEETFTSEHRAKTRYEQRKSNVDSY